MNPASFGGPAAAPLPPAPRLLIADAVAAVIELEDGRYLLQRRDDIPEIWFPGHWGCFGGAIDFGEEPLAALQRELAEEIEFKLGEATNFTRLDFDLSALGLGRLSRIYYAVRMTHAEHARLVLHEGAGMEAFAGDALGSLRLAPYDAFALFLYHQRRRLGRDPPR